MIFQCPCCTEETNMDEAEFDGYGWLSKCGCGRWLWPDFEAFPEEE